MTLGKKGIGLLVRGLMVALVVSLALFLGLLEQIERWGLNNEFSIRGPVPPKTPIVIVSIDEDSFDELEFQWPWPRSMHAQFIDTLNMGQPAVIGFDVLFSEPSALGPEDDQALGEAIGRAGNVVLAAALTIVEGGFYTKENLNPPIPSIREQAAGYGPVNLVLDDDAFVRQAQLIFPYQGKQVSGFSALLYQKALDAGIPAQPIQAQQILINFRGPPRTFETIPYYRVLLGEIPPEYFHNKIVLVGATSFLLHDVYPTPFATSGEMPAVEIHANVLETLIQGIPITRTPLIVSVVLIFLGGIFAVWITNQLRPLPAMGVLIGVAAGFVLLAFMLFVKGHLWMDLLPLPLTLTIGYGITVVENFIREQREKYRLSLYFSPSVLTDIIRHRSEATLGTSRHVVTILFSDIRGFTTLSEKMAPEEVATFLREYLTEMTDSVFSHGGTVDKYIGDAIMALYNVPFAQPDHAIQAVRTALEFQKRLRPLSERFLAKYGREVVCGVGINTGEAVVGTMGSAQRFEYTAIGDAINLGARLESITKEYETSIIISQSTYEEIKGQCLTRYLDEVRLKGKEIPVKIYAVLEEDTRQEPRVEVAGEVTVGENPRARIRDISRSGIAINQFQGTVGTGDVTPLIIHVPTLPRPIQLQGKVIWNGKTTVGFLSLNPKPEDQASIEKVIAGKGGEAS